MKIALLEIENKKHPTVYGDFAGGFGAGFVPGKSILSRLVGYAKHHGIDLPLVSFGYIGSLFKKNGHEVFYSRNSIPEADHYIIHSSLTGFREQISAADKIRNVKKKPLGFIGPFSAVKQDLFQDVSDYIVVGEPEAAMIACAEGKKLEGIVPSEPVSPLDSLPYPDWSIFGDCRFSYFPSLMRRPVLPIMGSRGCPDKCIYCPYKVQYATFRARKPEAIVAEMRHGIEKHQARGFLFRDPFFTFSRKRTEHFASLLLEKNIRVPWVCETKIDSLDEGLLDLLHRSGLRTVNVGIESVSADILKKAGRHSLDEQRISAIITHCDRIGIKVACFFILGWPEDTRESIEATIGYAIRLNPHIATFTLFTPFPGTPAFADLEDNLLTTDWSLFDVMNVTYRHRLLSPGELLDLKEKAYLRYYYRPGYIRSFFRRVMR